MCVLLRLVLAMVCMIMPCALKDGDLQMTIDNARVATSDDYASTMWDLVTALVSEESMRNLSNGSE